MIYKPTSCEPLLLTFDATQTPFFLECQIDSANTKVDAYSIKLLNSDTNEIVFGHEDDTFNDTITLVSDLQTYFNANYADYGVGYTNLNTGLNGSFIKIPFIVSSNQGQTTVQRNQIYYDGDNFVDSSDTSSEIDIYNGIGYKWQITFYQLEKQGQIYVKPEKPKYYDMLVTNGVIMGSNYKRIQSIKTDQIFSDYYIQLCYIPGMVVYDDGSYEQIVREFSTFDASIKYYQGEVIYDNTADKYYYNLTGNAGSGFDDETNWLQITSATDDIKLWNINWTVSTQLPAGQIVIYNKKFYKHLTSTCAIMDAYQSPDVDTAAWAAITPGEGAVILDWDNTILYQTGDIVSYESSYYQKNNNGQTNIYKYPSIDRVNWAEYINNPLNVGNRVKIKTYDQTYGHIYPEVGSDGFQDYEVTPENSNAFQIYKRGGNPDNLTVYQKVNFVVGQYVEMEWVETLSNPSESHGKYTYYMASNPNNVFQIPGIDTPLRGNERIVLNHQGQLGANNIITNPGTSNDASPYNGIFYPTFTVTKHPVEYQSPDDYTYPNDVWRIAIVLNSTEVSGATTWDQSNTYSLDAVVKDSDDKYYYKSLINNNSASLSDTTAWSLGMTSAQYTSSTVWTNSRQYQIGAFVYIASGGVNTYYLCTSNTQTQVQHSDEYQIDVLWYRTPDADTWGEISNKIVYVEGTDNGGYVHQNIQIQNLSNSIVNNGTINITPLLFVAEQPLGIFDGAFNYGPIFYNNISDYTNNIDGKVYIRPFIGIQKDQILMLNSQSNEQYFVYIDYINTDYWYIKYNKLNVYDIITQDINHDGIPADSSWYWQIDNSKYAIKTFHRDSDENPFYFNTAPLITITMLDVDDGETPIPGSYVVYNKNGEYSIDTIVLYKSQYFSCSEPSVYEWSSGIKYLAGDYAHISGSQQKYCAVRDHTSSSTNEPGSGTDWAQYWVALSSSDKIENKKPIVSQQIAEYDAANSYEPGNVVYYSEDDKFYECIQHAGTAVYPPNPIYWRSYQWQNYVAYIDSRTLLCSADYYQNEYIQWKSAQWFLYDLNGNVIDKSDIIYDGEIKYTFNGLGGKINGEAERYYIIELIVETYQGFRMVVPQIIYINFEVEEIESGDIISTTFDCDRLGVVSTLKFASSFIKAGSGNASYDFNESSNTGTMLLDGEMVYAKTTQDVRSHPSSSEEDIKSDSSQLEIKMATKIKSQDFTGKIFGISTSSDNESLIKSSFDIYIPDQLRLLENGLEEYYKIEQDGTTYSDPLVWLNNAERFLIKIRNNDTSIDNSVRLYNNIGTTFNMADSQRVGNPTYTIFDNGVKYSESNIVKFNGQYYIKNSTPQSHTDPGDPSSPFKNPDDDRAAWDNYNNDTGLYNNAWNDGAKAIGGQDKSYLTVSEWQPKNLQTNGTTTNYLPVTFANVIEVGKSCRHAKGVYLADGVVYINDITGEDNGMYNKKFINVNSPFNVYNTTLNSGQAQQISVKHVQQRGLSHYNFYTPNDSNITIDMFPAMQFYVSDQQGGGNITALYLYGPTPQIFSDLIYVPQNIAANATSDQDRSSVNIMQSNVFDLRSDYNPQLSDCAGCISDTINDVNVVLFDGAPMFLLGPDDLSTGSINVNAELIAEYYVEGEPGSSSTTYNNTLLMSQQQKRADNQFFNDDSSNFEYVNAERKQLENKVLSIDIPLKASNDMVNIEYGSGIEPAIFITSDFINAND